MRPVIPKVHAGDVLRGTRNLRRYIQTAALVNYLGEMGSGGSKDKTLLYSPSKDEEYVVLVNAWGSFCAMNFRTSVGLLFHNPKPKLSPERSSREIPFMDPTIFSQWFVRTEEKIPDTRKWPDYAVYIWYALQLNMTNVNDSNHALTVPTFPGSLAPFNYSRTARGVSRDNLAKSLALWIVRGITRPSAPDRGRLGTKGFGPRLEDIRSMEEEIKNLCSNPRIAQRLRTESKVLYQAIMGTNS